MEPSTVVLGLRQGASCRWLGELQLSATSAVSGGWAKPFVEAFSLAGRLLFSVVRFKIRNVTEHLPDRNGRGLSFACGPRIGQKPPTQDNRRNSSVRRQAWRKGWTIGAEADAQASSSAGGTNIIEFSVVCSQVKRWQGSDQFACSAVVRRRALEMYRHLPVARLRSLSAADSQHGRRSLRLRMIQGR